MARFILPVSVFAVLVVFLAIGLNLNPTRVPSPLIGKPAPQFKLPHLEDAHTSLTTRDLHGQVSLLNVWATWCVTCRQEHPVLVDFARHNNVPIYGLDYKDNRAKAMRWLDDYGNPYSANGFDKDGQVAINWGVYGTPETFVVDANGIIRHKHIGPLSRKDLRDTILPLIHKLRNSQG